MSVADKITRLKTARDNIRTALANYDIDASDHGFEDFADDIEGITIFDPDEYAVNVIETTGDPMIIGREYKYMTKAETMPQDKGYWDRQDVVEVQLPITLKRLKDNAFCMDAGESKLERVNLEHITHVGARAFGWCSKMRIFNFENVTSLAANFLVGYNSRPNIVYDVEEILLPKLETVPQLIPNGYKVISTRYPNLRLIDLSGAKTLGTGQTIMSSDWTDSQNHTGIKLGSDVEVIGDYAFQNMGYNWIVGGVLNFPKLTNLGRSAFNHTGITKVINLGSITEIKTDTFRESYVLTFVRIPSTVTTIGNNAFHGLRGMTMVVEAVTPPSTSSTPSADAIYVPDESVDEYKAATGWSGKASVIHPMSEYTGTD